MNDEKYKRELASWQGGESYPNVGD